jgi:transposase
VRGLHLSADERAALDERCATEQQVRRWRRYRAIWLRGEGQSVQEVADALGCHVSSVSNWTAAWRKQGLAGLEEGLHRGRKPLLEGPAVPLLEELLTSAPEAHGWQATGWTVPLLQAELARKGYPVSAHTVRRSLHRQHWRWKRPKYVLGRPDPAYAEKRGR